MTDELTRKRLMILKAGKVTTMGVELFALAFQSEGSEAIGVVAREVFRPYKFYTNVEAPGISSMNGLYFEAAGSWGEAGQNDTENQWLGGPVDLWEFSTLHVNEMRTAFLEEHGLTGKTDNQIQRYLDDNELSMPDVPRLEFPSLVQGTRVRFTGTFGAVTGFSLFGHVPVKPVVRRRG